MRKVVVMLLFVLLSASAFGQDKYDIYEPLLYEPDVYVPMDTGAPLDRHPYVDTTVHADLSNLVDFIDLSKNIRTRLENMTVISKDISNWRRRCWQKISLSMTTCLIKNL